jgi:hypothetical protein
MQYILLGVVWIFLLIGLILVFFRVRKNAGNYEAIFETEHLREFAEGVRKLKAEAFGAPRPEDEQSDLPPNAVKTSAGLIVVYTAEAREEAWLHHFSMSYQGGPFEPQTARFLTAYFQLLLGREGQGKELGLTRAGRYHLEWKLDQTEHEALAAREVPVPSAEELAPILVQVAAGAEQIRIFTLRV